MAKVGPDKRNVVPLGEQQAKQPRGEAVRAKLLDAAEALLLEQDAHQLRLDNVLADAGVARNTLYKHFKDLEALAEEALLRGFARNVELDAQAISGALGRCKSKGDFRQAMTAITRATQSGDRAPRRMLRIKLLAMASSLILSIRLGARSPLWVARVMAVIACLKSPLLLQRPSAPEMAWASSSTFLAKPLSKASSARASRSLKCL